MLNKHQELTTLPCKGKHRRKASLLFSFRMFVFENSFHRFCQTHHFGYIWLSTGTGMLFLRATSTQIN